MGSGLSDATRTLGCSSTVVASMVLRAWRNRVISFLGREGLGCCSHSDRTLIHVRRKWDQEGGEVNCRNLCLHRTAHDALTAD